MADDPTPDEGGSKQDEGKPFTPIATQADLDRIIGERIARERGKYADYDDLKAKAEKFDQAEQASLSEIERERQAREAAETELNKYRQREQVQTWAKDIAKDAPELAPLLRGSTKEELEEHFSQLSSLAAKGPVRTATPPGKPVPADGEKGRAAAALRALRQG